jgi:PAS domain S-box-containing protein
MDTDYRLIAESAEDSIFIVDRDFKITYVNTFGAGLLGGSPEMIAGQRLDALFPAKSVKTQKESIEKIFATGKPLYVEDNYSFKSRGVWLSTRLIPIHDNQGYVTAILGISRDISELKATEKDLRASHKQLNERLKFMTALNKMGTLLISSNDSKELLGLMAEGIGETLGADAAIVCRVDFEENVVERVTTWRTAGAPEAKSPKGRYNISMFLGGTQALWKMKKPIVSHYDKVNPAFLADGSSEILHSQRGIKSILIYPFAFRKDGYDVLVLAHYKRRHEWAEEEIRMIDSCTNQLTIALQKIEYIKNKEN